MIAFATLFLGLVVGILPVKLAVGASVSRVELELDGGSIGCLDHKPWSIPVDLGRDLSPHELVARAFDSSGHEVGIARQWLNLPGPRAETQVLLERNAKGEATAARLVWASVLGSSPKTMAVTFDGRPLTPDSSGKVALPDHDPAATHILSADLRFSDDVRSHADLVLGGGPAGEASSELTALPVTLRKGQKLPPVSGLQGWFVRQGRPVAVAAVEHGPADVLVVRELGTSAARESLGIAAPVRAGVDGFPIHDVGSSADALRLGSDDRIRIAWPVAQQVGGREGSSELFEQSQEFRGAETGFRSLLTRVNYPGAGVATPRFADAVAIAGLRAFSGRSRRAVVLILPEGSDASLSSPETVRGYLARIHVPLFVWSLTPPAGVSPWGTVEDIATPARLEKAVRRLRDELAAQQMIWLVGKHLPQEVVLSDEPSRAQAGAVLVD